MTKDSPTSCGGTLNVAVRKSTLIIVSIHGKIQNKPGPLAPPKYKTLTSVFCFSQLKLIPGKLRPRRRITARSYS